MLAGFQGIHSDKAVGAVGGEDMDNLDVLILEHLLVVRIDFGVFGAVFGGGFHGALFDDIAESHHLHTFHGL